MQFDSTCLTTTIEFVTFSDNDKAIKYCGDWDDVMWFKLTDEMKVEIEKWLNTTLPM